MFKLPLLQPHLTGTGGVEGRRRSLTGYNPFTNTFNGSRREGMESAPAGLGSPIEVKSWESQAKDITADIASSEKYKSLVLHAEVKLAEALERCNRVQPTAYASTGEEKPNRLKTAVCCQLLGEFSDLCGPFSGVLKSLRDELLKSVYSGYYVSEKGMLVFDQLTWFTVAERLEKEKAVMLEEREKFQQQLAEQQECLSRIEEQMLTYQRAMNAAQVEAASMKSKMENLIAMHDSAKLEAKTGREELKRARKEWLKMKDELDAERDAHKQLKVQHDQTVAECKALTSGQDHLQQSLAETQRQLELRLPVDAIQGIEQQLQEAMQQLKEARGKEAELQAQVQQLQAEAEAMTPRPKCTDQLKAHGIVAKEGVHRTQNLLTQAADKLDAYLSESVALSEQLQASTLRMEGLERQGELLAAALKPEPLPRSVQLSVTTDTSAYFITEEDQGAGAASTSALAAEGLGLGADIPRCLRWPSGSMVQLEPWSASLEATEQVAADLWRAKQAHERSHPPQHMLSFIYTFFSALWAAPLQLPSPGAADGGPAAGGAGAGAGAGAGGASPLGAPKGIAAAVATHEAALRRCYSLFHACSCHAASSPPLQLLAAVLTGHLSEQAASDQRALFEGLLRALRALPGGKGGDGAGVSVQQAQEVLQQLLPGAGQLQVHRLKGALSSAFPGDTVTMKTLEAALRPPLPSTSPGIPRSSGAADAVREFAQALAGHHLEALESFGEQVEATLRGKIGPESGGKTVPLTKVVEALQEHMPKDQAVSCVVSTLAGSAHACGAGGTGTEAADLLLLEQGAEVESAHVARLLRAFCLLRPKGCFDTSAACAWAASKAK